MAKLMDGGFVYGIEHVPELIEQGIKNIRKHNEDLIDDGKIIFQEGDGRDGLTEHGPYDAIHVGASVQKIPRPLLK